MRKLYFILSLMCITAACSTSKINTSERELVEVRFGNYGGFSNNSMEYILLANGQVSKIENNLQKSLFKIKNKEVQKISNQLKSIGFGKLKINDLGNLTYFIKVTTKDYENSVKWNDETQNNELKNTYKMLTEILQQHKSHL